jgi:HK97 gp10 family phage protein
MARALVRGNRNSISRDARKAVSVEGLKEITDKIESIANAVGGQKVAPEIKQVSYEGGKMLADEWKANAAYDPDRKRGIHYRDAIFVSMGDETKPDVLVGVNYRKAPHAHFVEYGTEKMAARPALRPAISRVGPRIASHIKSGLIKVIERFTK